ncbi:MAG: PHP domain-containing protein [Jatrophihabitantaceae bacterium]
MIDLHCHSTASDGTDTPTELVANAVAAGLRVMAITDHDTTGGWTEATEAVHALPTAFTLVPGAEFSCTHTGPDRRPITLHILGYLFDPDAPGLRAERARLRRSRLDRAAEIVEALAADGYPISWSQVADLAGDGVVGRPHLGQALQQSGVVASVDEAFADLLSDTSRYYRPKADSPAVDLIGLVGQAGGATVIAHPWARRRGSVLAEPALAELVAAGLAGIEVDHVDHTLADRARLRELVAEWQLLGTGSSDYHGTHKAVRLGAETTSADTLDRLLTLTSGVVPVHSPGGQ